MTPEKVLEVIARYRTTCHNFAVPQKEYSHCNYLPPRQRRFLAMSHCHSMLDQMEEFVKEGRMDKVFRWLGFIQGVLWVLRVFTLDQLKSHNQSD